MNSTLSFAFSKAMSSSSINLPAGPTIGACYLPTNSCDFSNLGCYSLKNGQALFNIGIIFAANLAGTTDQPTLYLNPTVTATLQSGEIAKLQSKGMRVVLSILGNHQPAGLSTLTGNGPQIFAQALAKVVTQYGLDGIDFDDEYGGETAPYSPSSFPLLVSAIRQLLPQTIMSLYFIGGASQSLSWGKITVGSLINYAWNPYYSSYSAPSVPGLGKSSLGAAAINMRPGTNTYTPPTLAAEFAQKTIKDGYGVYLYYDLINGNISSYLSNVSNSLYGQATVYSPPS